MFKVNNKETRMTPVSKPGGFIVNFEHISHLVLMPTGLLMLTATESLKSFASN